jgi:hypothetical protein
MQEGDGIFVILDEGLSQIDESPMGQHQEAAVHLGRAAQSRGNWRSPANIYRSESETGRQFDRPNLSSARRNAVSRSLISCPRFNGTFETRNGLSPCKGDIHMRAIILLVTTASVLVGQPLWAKGCIRGAAAGGVSGHFVGKGNAIVGAAVGCVVAHHHYAKQARAEKTAARHNG